MVRVESRGRLVGGVHAPVGREAVETGTRRAEDEMAGVILGGDLQHREWGRHGDEKEGRRAVAGVQRCGA